MSFFKSKSTPDYGAGYVPYNGGYNAPKRTSPLKKALMLAAMPVLVLGGSGYGLTQYMKIEKPDEYGCFDRDDQHKVAVAIDFSLGSDLSETRLREYRRILFNTYKTAPENSVVYVFTTASDVDGSVAEPVATACKPAATQAEMAAIGAPEQQPAYLKRQSDAAKAAFEDMTEQVLRDAQDDQKGASYSPLLERLQGISRYAGFSGPNRSMVWISDGVQNSRTAQFCAVKGDLPPFAVFKTQQRYREVAPNSFEGMDVKILLVEDTQFPHPRAPFCRNSEIRRFWEQYYDDNDAAHVELTLIGNGL